MQRITCITNSKHLTQKNVAHATIKEMLRLSHDQAYVPTSPDVPDGFSMPCIAASAMYCNVLYQRCPCSAAERRVWSHLPQSITVVSTLATTATSLLLLLLLLLGVSTVAPCRCFSTGMPGTTYTSKGATVTTPKMERQVLISEVNSRF